MNRGRPITVLLAEDHMVVREGLRKLLDAETDLEVVGEAASGREAVELTRALRPDVIVMDVAMPLLNGLEATRQVHLSVPGTRVLILSAHSDDAYVESATTAGASGYLIKQTSAHFLAEAIREVHAGRTFFSPVIDQRRRRRQEEARGRRGRPGAKVVVLSARQREVLQLVAEGMANKQIAAELGISIKTVEKHRDHLMCALDIHDTAGLTRYAITHGIIEADIPLTIV